MEYYLSRMVECPQPIEQPGGSPSTCVESGAPLHFESDGLDGVDHELAAAHDGLLDVLLPQREGVRGRRLHLEGRHPRRRDVVLALVLGLLVKQHLPARLIWDAVYK